jgi:hypothetical protein
MYSGTARVTLGNAEDVLEAAELLELEFLKLLVEESLCKEINPENCFQFAALAQKYKLMKLQGAFRQKLTSGNGSQGAAANVPAAPKVVRSQPQNEAIVIHTSTGELALLHGDDSLDEIVGVPQKCLSSSACATPDGLVVSGGMQGSTGTRVADVYHYEAKTMTWSTLPSLRRPRFDHSSAFCNGSVYVIGGHCTEQRSNTAPYGGNQQCDIDVAATSVERYSLASTAWGEVAPLPDSCTPSSIVIAANRLFVLSFSTCTMYEVGRQSWDLKAPLPGQLGLSVTMNDDRIFGLITGLARAVCYDVASDQWSYVASPILSGITVGAVPWQQKIRVLCTVNRCDLLSTEFDPNTNTWAPRRNRIPLGHFSNCVNVFIMTIRRQN